MFSLFKIESLYIRIYSDYIEIRHLEKNIDIKRKAIDRFSNSRLILAEYYVAENFLLNLIKELYKGERIKSSLQILNQPIAIIDGGLSQVERRAFLDLGEHIGGRKVIIYEKQDKLTDTLVLDILNSKQS